MKLKSAVKSLFTIKPAENLVTYVEACSCLLRNFKNHSFISEGRALHGLLVKMGLQLQRDIAVELLTFYLKFRRSSEADQVLRDFNGFDLVVYNCLISANVQWGNLHEACRLFDEMPERNEFSWTALISCLMKNGRVKEAICYFERNPFHNVVSWTAAISGLVQNGLNLDALKHFRKMLQFKVMPNAVTFSSLVKACTGLGDYELGMCLLGLIVKAGFEENISVSNSLITLCLKLGETDVARTIFDQMKKKDVVSWTAILDMYADAGDLGEARRVFGEMPRRNEVSWSAMIARYSQGGYAAEATKLFQQMVQEGLNPNVSCLSCIISALASLKALLVGMNIHGHAVKVGLESDAFISSSLIDLYCKCGSIEDGRAVFDSTANRNVASWNSMLSGYSLNGQLEEAKELFEQIPEKNIVSWNAIITGYLENRLLDDVFELFHQMMLSGEIPNSSTFSSVVSASASKASLEKGKYLHGKIIKLHVHDDIFVETTLVAMYAKSGDIESSKLVFQRMSEKNEVSWTVMIQGLAENGFPEDSILVFEEMERRSTVFPNELMLLPLLFACSHCRLIDKGLWYFNSMEKTYGIKPNSRHYSCMVDLLSRSGRFSDAENLIRNMPFKPEYDAWASLLSGCSTFGDEDIAERSSMVFLELAEENPAGYVLLANVYASCGRWIDVSNIRTLMMEKKLTKDRGCSWIEIRDRVHSFCSDDRAHLKSAMIYETLTFLRTEMLALQRSSL
ncbi:hypothetical protein Nepgr_014567 [Nepenthes gracilis]|uniref:Pentatricopeptide repeat-containing protein At2g13600-like n=1 Tax=Nepenthes gracilis TaxID=150966 RepID=A0AAD3SLD8_NEPGR|nr:hypothetical protein Nepgr_014567 [Nepenthes gracilis]